MFLFSFFINVNYVVLQKDIYKTPSKKQEVREKTDKDILE
jgi:hypothetical protein